jgi:lipopolysaccharide/colanic/teichoic acid biosynthesis glycosyltransferase
MSFVASDSEDAEVTISARTDCALVSNSGECTIHSRSTARASEPRSKRLFDIALSFTGLILSAWLWSVIWIMIILDDGMPVIIRQRRIGKDGKQFDSFKFRSMVKGTRSEEISSQAAEHDGRVTKVGRFLRPMALDELPQLINILKGEMSFVGPRPLLPSEFEINGDSDMTDITSVPNFSARTAVRPGLTGVAQVFAPRDVPRKHKFKYDLLYSRIMNFRYDLLLIVLSFLITFSCAWEKRTSKLPSLKRHT